MNNLAPLKRHRALMAFSRDHHFGLLLVWKIKQGLDIAVAPERISNYVLYFFERDLKDHFEEEEQILFPKLPVDHLLRQQAENEHTIIKGLIEQIRKDRANKQLLLQFAQHLKDHIRFEERVLFTAIQEVTGDHDAEKSSKHSSNRNNDVDSGWNDQFWAVEKKCNL
jgi:iron-sulfur cluster repair protein YtfE (RIC family)